MFLICCLLKLFCDIFCVVSLSSGNCWIVSGDPLLEKIGHPGYPAREYKSPWQLTFGWGLKSRCNWKLHLQVVVLHVLPCQLVLSLALVSNSRGKSSPTMVRSCSKDLQKATKKDGQMSPLVFLFCGPQKLPSPESRVLTCGLKAPKGRSDLKRVSTQRVSWFAYKEKWFGNSSMKYEVVLYICQIMSFSKPWSIKIFQKNPVASCGNEHVRRKRWNTVYGLQAAAVKSWSNWFDQLILNLKLTIQFMSIKETVELGWAICNMTRQPLYFQKYRRAHCKLYCPKLLVSIHIVLCRFWCSR